MPRAFVRFCLWCALLAVVSGCVTVASRPRLSPAEVRRLADDRAKQICGCDLRTYHTLEPKYVSHDGSWVVIYHHKTQTRMDIRVSVYDDAGSGYPVYVFP